MGKLGGKARKFAKKNLQSVLKRKRKLKSFFKKKSSKRGGSSTEELVDRNSSGPDFSDGRVLDANDIEATSFDAFFGQTSSDGSADDSGSDGYLSDVTIDEILKIDADSLWNPATNEKDAGNELSEENRTILIQLQNNEKKLKRLKGKDPKFSNFLQRSKSHAKALRDKKNLYEDETIIHSPDESDGNTKGMLSDRAVDSLCKIAKENNNLQALIMLLNAYRTACHYGVETNCEASCSTLAKIAMFMISEGGYIFQKMMGLSCNNVGEIKKSSSWETLNPLVKCYLRNSLHFLLEVTDPEMLAYSISKLRPFVTYFAAFPYLLKRLLKISTHLWVTCQGATSQQSFLIIQDIATISDSEWFDTCFSESYKKYITHCQSVEPEFFDHIQFVKNSFVQFCGIDIQTSFCQAVASMRFLRNVLLVAMKSKKKEAIKRVCSWQYINCIDLWVTFLSVYVRDYDLNALLHMLIEVINAVAILFPGPRYLPLRTNCIKWLNHLSNSSGMFIPVASLTLDILDYKLHNGGKKIRSELPLSSYIKLPKHCLKSTEFQELSIHSVIHLLTMHFVQWSYHISFPELATIPIIRMRNYAESTPLESLRRVLSRFIDQVEHNKEFVMKKRDDAPFSPKDQQSADSFLQLEKSKGNAPFMQYYRSILERASQKSLLNEKQRFVLFSV